MDNRTRKICRFCQKIGYDYFTTGEIAKQMSDALLKLKLNVSKESVICNECLTKLQNFVDFKLSCCEVENRIRMANPKDEKLISKENIQENDTMLNSSEDQKICRFCKKLMRSECAIHLYETKDNIFMIDMVQKYIPELHLNNIEELVACETCLTILWNLLNFIKNCLAIEDKGNINEADNKIQLPLKDAEDSKTWYEESCNNVNIDTSLAELKAICNETGENVNWKCEVKDESSNLDQLNIENEEIEIKLEPNNCESSRCSPPQFASESMPIHKSSSEFKPYKCEKCSYRAKHRSTLKNHTKTHQRTKTKQCQNTPEKKVYKCDICSFETKYRGNLTQHIWTHQNKSDLPIYHCEHCLYQTRLKKGLQSHIKIRHNHNPSELKIYKCDICSFETRHKNSLEVHTLIHQGSFYSKMYKCESCPFQTKHITSFKQHAMMHQNPADLTTYACDRCTFETKHKNSLKMHMLTHRNPQEIKMYKCDKCSYEMKYKTSLRRHIMLTHQSPSQITMYKCGTCAFETKFKNGLNIHIQTHLNPSEIKMYECEKCPYKARQNSNLKRHMTTH